MRNALCGRSGLPPGESRRFLLIFTAGAEAPSGFGHGRLRKLTLPARRRRESAFVLASQRKLPAPHGRAVLRRLKSAARRVRETALVRISASRECQLAKAAEVPAFAFFWTPGAYAPGSPLVCARFVLADCKSSRLFSLRSGSSCSRPKTQDLAKSAARRVPIAGNELPISNHECEHEHERLFFHWSGSSRARRTAQAASRFSSSAERFAPAFLCGLSASPGLHSEPRTSVRGGNTEVGTRSVIFTFFSVSSSRRLVACRSPVTSCRFRITSASTSTNDCFSTGAEAPAQGAGRKPQAYSCLGAEALLHPPNLHVPRS